MSLIFNKLKNYYNEIINIMLTRLILTTALLWGQLLLSQEITKIEFDHSNSIMRKEMNIILEPIKNNEKGKVRVIVKKESDESYTSIISKKKYTEICNLVLKAPKKYFFKSKKDSVKTTSMDGTYTFITIFQNNFKTQYFMEYISSKDKINPDKKDFWHLTKLIMQAAKLNMEDLIDYK